MGPCRSTISIQNKFITIEDPSKSRSKEKVRILRKNVSSDYIQYICMDGLRNQLEFCDQDKVQVCGMQSWFHIMKLLTSIQIILITKKI